MSVNVTWGHGLQRKVEARLEAWNVRPVSTKQWQQVVAKGVQTLLGKPEACGMYTDGLVRACEFRIDISCLSKMLRQHLWSYLSR